MKHIVSWSGGKDSTATIILAKRMGLPMDGIVTVMPDPFKLDLAFKGKVEAWTGIPITVVDGPKFEDYFYRVKVRGPYKGTIYGWPFTVYRACARVMKWEPMKLWASGEPVSFVLGIAADETKRFGAVENPNRSYLMEQGITEAMARQMCEEEGLLHPLYKHFKRLGCVRCPKQSLKALAKVRELEPEKWQWCIDHDYKSPVTFKPGKTFCEIATALTKET